MLDSLQHNMQILKVQLGAMLSAVPNLPDIGPFVFRRIVKGYDPDHIWWMGLELIVIFAGAAIGEALARRRFLPLHRLLPALDLRSDFGKLGALLVAALIRIAELAIFGLVVIILFFAVFDGHQAARHAFWTLFSFVVLVRAGAIMLRILLAPSLPALRLQQLDSQTALYLYRRLLLILALLTAAGLSNGFLNIIGLPQPLLLAFGELSLAICTFALIVSIWSGRAAIAELIGAHSDRQDQRRNDLGALFATYWHVLVTCLLIAVAILASVNRLVTGQLQASRIFETLAILISLPLLDGLIRMAIASYFSPPGGETAPDTNRTATDGDRPPAERGATSGNTVDAAYGMVIIRNARIALAVTAVVLLSWTWNIGFSDLGSGGLGPRVAEALFQIIITLLLASSAWGIAKVAINRHLPHEKLDALQLSDDGAGTGLSRLETLLPLVRMFLFVIIVTIALMSVISAMGVNIGPLMAGAGVVGIAVGFGAQTLVRDVLSGIFFLFDDAFRIGEYVDVGEGKGTVERMSIRALLLRHHLGALNTIPFGVIRRVTNYSRDWMIMKLEVRVPFDTDLEKLRKVVKQAGKELAESPEFGPMFLQPLKSQGVNRVDNSAFVIRVKFTAKPNGDAFILRRQVFRSVQEAFQQNGIKFAAHRVVVDHDANDDAAAADLTVLPIDRTGDRQQMSRG